MEPAYYYDLDEAEPPPLSSASYDESFYENENYGGNATPVAEASSDYDLMVGNMTRRQFLEGQVQAMLAGWSNHVRKNNEFNEGHQSEPISCFPASNLVALAARPHRLIHAHDPDWIYGKSDGHLRRCKVRANKKYF